MSNTGDWRSKSTLRVPGWHPPPSTDPATVAVVPQNEWSQVRSLSHSRHLT